MAKVKAGTIKGAGVWLGKTTRRTAKLLGLKTITLKKAVFLIMAGIFLVGAGVLTYSVAYAKRSYPRIKVGTIAVGGKTPEEITSILNKTAAKVGKEDLTFVDGNKKWTIGVADLGLRYDVNATKDQVYSVGRGKTIGGRLWRRLAVLFTGETVQPTYTYNEKIFNEKIGEIAAKLDVPEQDATGVIKGNTVTIKDQQDGYRVDQEKIKTDFSKMVAAGEIGDVVIVINKVKPRVSTEEAIYAKKVAEAMLGQSVALKWQSGNYNIGADVIGPWIEFVAKPNGGNYTLVAQLNDAKVRGYAQGLAGQIDRQPTDAKLSINNGQLGIIQAGQDGYKLDQLAATKLIKEAVAGKTATVELPVVVDQSDVSVNNLNNLGITDLLGTATTTMTGSPVNRIHNIQTGVTFLNGLIVKPGEEFSTVKSLGKVDGSTGYLPELVIKENATIPEYGGGLCQVSTTLFRSILNAGLKVTARSPHAYRVIYYETDGNGKFIGPGLDATIYIPSPDLKFLNDTGHYILVSGHIDGMKITFDLWGTKDGRVAQIDGPTILTTIPAPPEVDTPTDTLPVGVKQKTDTAHPGGTAVVYYTVTRAGEVLYKQTFKSTYVPWAAKYLVGTKQP